MTLVSKMNGLKTTTNVGKVHASGDEGASTFSSSISTTSDSFFYVRGN